MLYCITIDTPIGRMIALGDQSQLHLLEFADHQSLKTLPPCEKKETKPLASIQQELAAYFEGTLKEFKTPLLFVGTPFQKTVWEALQRIPYGQTRSYADVSREIQKPEAHRAVARSNSVNRFVIAVPCHRVIYADGSLGGYSSGLRRKEWLLKHEKIKS